MKYIKAALLYARGFVTIIISTWRWQRDMDRLTENYKRYCDGMDKR